MKAIAVKMLGLVLGGLAIAALIWIYGYESRVAASAHARFGEARLCWFDGVYAPSGPPIAVAGSDMSDVVHPWQDFSNRFLVSEGAKPFHFVVQVQRRDDQPPEVWGWSYRNADFWQDEDGNTFKLALASDPSNTCTMAF